MTPEVTFYDDSNKKKDRDHKKRIFKRNSFEIYETKLSYQRFDGRSTPIISRLSFERGDSVAALVFNLDTQKILLVKQFKYPTYKEGPGWITEVVAGAVKPVENHEAAIKREIYEEIGYTVKKIKKIAEFYVSPGGSSERIMLYSAAVVNQDKTGSGGGSPNENEDILTEELPLKELDAYLSKGFVQDAKTLIALQWLQRCVEHQGIPLNNKPFE